MIYIFTPWSMANMQSEADSMVFHHEEPVWEAELLREEGIFLYVFLVHDGI